MNAGAAGNYGQVKINCLQNNTVRI